MDRRLMGQWGRLLLVVATIGGGFWLAGRALPYLYPFLLGWLLAYALNPIVDLLQRGARAPRWLAVVLTLIVFAASMLTVVSALVVRLINEIMTLSGSLQGLVIWVQMTFDRFLERPEWQRLLARLNAFYQQNPSYQAPIDGRISETAQALAQAGTNLLKAILNGIVTVLASLPEIATLAAVILLASFFISKDWRAHQGRIGAWFPEPMRRRTGAVLRDLRHALIGYARAQFLLISITAVAVTLGLLIIGVENAVTIGLLIGFVDLLPYLGVGAAMIPWIAYQYLSGDWRLATALAVLYGVVLIARQIIEPKVLSSSIGLDPLPTLIIMFVGLKMFGFAGLVFGPIVLVVLSACRRAGVFRDLGRYIAHGAK
ncbi:sporulation integral membrane protein YtvI [Cohnella nanjingensis]|uniref:Sporulation integral membrane protein YtvI n=1 Tax=Cohnella nanjingensis TaxID=1387779 RepID=A0A7X0RR89_9BACL|nr:sporulation integral membrane protein YtvI [Cohnella nanjingensis]MBB6671041.1 sporulation integral membrane protein YtvI [Cohnella nanjingensis]